MTVTTDHHISTEHQDTGGVPAEEPDATHTSEQDTPPPTDPEFRMVPVGELQAHPGNVRTDLKIKKSFVAGIRERGVRQPLVVNRHPDGRLEVVIGHRRLAAAIEAGRKTVPCLIEDATAKHQAEDFLDMHAENTEREDLTPLEEAQALFSAKELGYSMTRISKKTGLKPERVKAAFAAATVGQDAREMVGEYDLDIEWLALVKEFEDDPDAVADILRYRRLGRSLDYIAELLRKARADKEEQARLVAEFEAKGYRVTVSDTLPSTGRYLGDLSHDGQALTPDTHAECPGRAVMFRSYEPTRPVHYCDQPTKHGHTDRYATNVAAASTATGPSQKKANTGPSRKFVSNANRKWEAAGAARHKFLIALFDRKTPPKEIDEFVTEELLTMPEPLRKWLGGITSNTLFRKLLRHEDLRPWGRDNAQEVIAKDTTKRRALLRFAPIAAAYEYGLTQAGESKNTWRTDKWSPMDQKDAGRYFRLLRACGYNLAPIETALADGKPYTGDDLGKPLIEVLANEAIDEPEETGPEEAQREETGPEEAQREETGPEEAQREETEPEGCADPDCRFDPADPSVGHSYDCQVTAWTEPEDDPDYAEEPEQANAA